ncbi:TAXI family TRAP transporter solute-binding subunit [Chryseolinea sp. T2]|uniref:TAXI family TRAP transporter solute-binding subunit n=1 Tax=Chryseolinea sp. T2 TaxID=3129255 RepID=UPI00307782C7
MKKYPSRLYTLASILGLIALTVVSCDIYHPQKRFRIAVPKTDVLYNTMLSHVKSLLERAGYEISVVYTDRNIEANQLVAKGEADLAFVNNVSSHIIEGLGDDASELRCVLPMTKRALLGFTRQPTRGQNTRQILENKTIGVEILNGEGHGNITQLFSRAHINNIRIVQSDRDSFDVRLFWGSPYSNRSQQMLDSGWQAISFSEDWVDFQTLGDPTLEPLTFPALPGDLHSTAIHTFATDAILVTRKDVGENAIFQLAETILQGKMALVRKDPMYRSISESISRSTLLFPLHEGTSSYLRRDTPTFLERYADTLALVLSIAVLLYSIVQAVNNRLRQIKKDRIDQYFLEFLDIRSKNDLTVQQQSDRLNDLFQRALLQMTNEKMDKNDFHIFSRLLQQELTNLRLR